MNPDLVSLLSEPHVGAPLDLEPVETDDGNVRSGNLRTSSGLIYPIKDGVPRFVTVDPYAESFGMQWNRFADVQLDSVSDRTSSTRRFVDETGWDPAELDGQVVVDAGCGSGRFAEVAAGFGATVLAVDLSSAVVAAERNLRRYRNVMVIQADLRSLPVDFSKVGFVYSIGVLQHTPAPMQSARSLILPMRPGTRFAFTVYARQPWTRLHGKYLVRPITRRMQPSSLLRLVERVMPAAYSVTSRLYRLRRTGPAFQFILPVANYVHATEGSAEIRYREAVLDTFDMLSPRYDRPVRAREFADSLEDLAKVELISSRPAIVRGVRR